MNKKTPNFPQCYELVLGIRKTLNNISIYHEYHKLAINDLKDAYNELVKYCNFTYSTMFDKFPRLCLMTSI